ncbi:metalloregulator ArsR/SmtB family transcription factor [Pseudomaricurvus sp. HS19]|uniref:metalloregulator ArsR/SmtB family transcription factor n=1 Tax=Pseudomaricurvus sp. HS19 TaxID=2692626 RepID=UPI00136FFFA0|nr:metalloregulator ArsR/SmtB family transcription factor [Pseudomaricurvus sp. HS19]MYM62629.1 metalloregulator ArsR/SmtB family transcription factor [Pseudomaricurvus sp. HS19]
MNPTAFFKSLADETRLQSLLLILHEGELCVCELTAALQEHQPKISRHLAQLKKTGVLSDRRQGQWVFYRLDPQLPDWAAQVLHTTAADNGAVIEDAMNRLRHMGERPERTRACC